MLCPFLLIIPQFLLTFFHHLHLVHEIKPLAVVLIQLDFKNRLIQRNWTFTLGLGLVLNNASSFDITMRIINKCYVKCKYNNCKFCCCVPHTKLSYWRFFWPATSKYLVGFILLPLKCSINFSLNLLRTGLLYLLYVMINSSFMPVHQLACHLDLN